MNKNQNFRNKGITLVALVITIIILLILAGISIATLTGSGLFENARLAEQKSKNAQELEDLTLKDYENKIGEYINSNRETIKLEPIEAEFGSFEMGSRSGITNNDLVKLKGLKNYKTLTIQCGGNMGTYISARIYIDNNLIETISDTLEHKISINNNEELKINFYCYNGLNNGNASVRLKAE